MSTLPTEIKICCNHSVNQHKTFLAWDVIVLLVVVLFYKAMSVKLPTYSLHA